MATPSTGIDICLHADAADLPDNGTRLLSTEGVAATLQLGDALQVDLAISSPTRAEARWETWQVLRRLKSLHPISDWRLSASAGVADETLATIGLDLHNAANGKLKIDGNATVEAEVARIGAAEDLYRAWVNEDPTKRTSLKIAADAVAFAEENEHVTCTVMAEDELEAEGMNLLLAVGGASQISPPRLVIARYDPPGASGAPLMLLGKGITFDTGGINVKPYESFVSMMKNDMGGAALAWGLFTALVRARHPWSIVVVMATCENPIGENAMRPGSIVHSYRGHKVRIDHTDAEGRLVLADGLAWASERHDPRLVVSFATLTTAALIAYGPYTTPVHFAGPELQSLLASASKRTGEDLHFMPVRAWHREANRDQEADLKNTGRLPGHAVRGAGSRNAGHFLRYFTDAPLCHCDIFATTWNWAGDAPGCGYGATGAPLRTWLHALLAAPDKGVDLEAIAAARTEAAR